MSAFLCRTVTMSSRKLGMCTCSRLNHCNRKFGITVTMNSEEKNPQNKKLTSMFQRVEFKELTAVRNDFARLWARLVLAFDSGKEKTKFVMEETYPDKDFSDEVTVLEKMFQRHFMIEELVTGLVKETKHLSRIQGVVENWLLSENFTSANAVQTLVKFAELFCCAIDECFPDFKHLSWSEKSIVLNIPHYHRIFCDKVRPQDYSNFVQQIVNIIEGDIESLNKLDTVAVLHALIILDVEAKWPYGQFIQHVFEKYLSFDVSGYSLEDMKKLLDLGHRQNESLFWDKQLKPLLNALNSFDEDVIKFCVDLELQCRCQVLLKDEWLSDLETFAANDASFCLRCLGWIKALEKTRNTQTSTDYNPLDVYVVLKRLKPKLECILKENCSQLKVSDFKTVYEQFMDFEEELKVQLSSQAKEFLNMNRSSPEEQFWCLCVYGSTEGLDLPLEMLKGMVQNCDLIGTTLLLHQTRQEPVPVMSNCDMRAAVLRNIGKHAHLLAKGNDNVLNVCAYLIDTFLSDYIIPSDVVSSLNSAVGPTFEHYSLMRLTLMSMDKGRSGNLLALCSQDVLLSLFNLNPYFYLTFVYAKYSDVVSKTSDDTTSTKAMEQFLECTHSRGMHPGYVRKLSLKHMYKVLKHSWNKSALSEILQLFGILSTEHLSGSADIDRNDLSLAVLSYMLEKIPQDEPLSITLLDMLYLGSLAVDFKEELLFKHPDSLQLLKHFVEEKLADELVFFSSKNSKDDCEYVLRLVNVCSYLGVDMATTLGQILTKRFMKQIYQKFKPMTESVLEVMCALNQDCCLLYPQLGVPWFQQPDVLQTILKKQLVRMARDVPLSLRERLQHTLSGVTIQEPVVLEYGLVPWLTLLVDKDNRPVEFTGHEIEFAEELGLKRVAVVYNAERGIDRFRDDSFREPVPIDVYLEKLGFTVIKITATRWDSSLFHSQGMDLTKMLNQSANI